jgi:hypothetical protein
MERRPNLAKMRAETVGYSLIIETSGNNDCVGRQARPPYQDVTG